ncbi:MAG: TetR/AcrR family transcriptional regulator [Dehalococcoidales bacterium]|nr:TetR/AcrR family transcriptional regulator [Dehalococcoidales bacterium]
MTPEEQAKERLSSEDRRVQIIDNALTLFAEKGFAGTRTREIAEAAGISETLIFQHFRTKDDLVRAALAALFHTRPVGGEMLEELHHTDDAGFFRGIAIHFIEHNRKDPRILKLVLHSTFEGRHFGELTQDDTGPSMLNLIAGYIKKRIDEDAFVPVNPEITARLFVEAVFMYIADTSMEISGPPLQISDEEVVDTLVAIFLGGLKKK